jgi:chemotaxis protein methyltransferase CheR
MSGLQHTQFPLGEGEFSTIVRLVREETGIVLGAQKRDLVYGRLAKRLRAMGFSDFSQYCELLESEDGEAERRNMVNAITTNLTGFFREPHHFEFLGSVLAELKEKNSTGNRLRIWSAGCSSGEEPYSIAMTVRDKLGAGPSLDAKILATDIDTNMVAHAKAGRYDASRMSTVSPEFRRRFFRKADEGYVAVADDLKSLITFNPLNLFDPWPMRGPFDVIFCRNVVIYFSKDDQRKLFGRYADFLAPGGYLFVGHSETLYGVTDRFRHLGRTIYQKVS